jgi:serine/threonine protein kinase/class 3 adenylate cyclase
VMDIERAKIERERVEAFLKNHRIGLLTLFFSDMVGSTQLKQRFGDIQAVTLIQRHHSLVRQLLLRFKDAEEISTAGDSFFLVFAKPSDAVQFALHLQKSLAELSFSTGNAIRDRLGIHLGEVFVSESLDHQRKDLYGMQIDLCARVMSLAEGNQILLTRPVFDSARQVLRGHDLPGLGDLSWLNHGPYKLQGIEDPVEICEVGEITRAIGRPPPDSTKVKRHISASDEPVLGWRPANDQTVPLTHWVLQRKLGEGGFGEVWLAFEPRLKEERVFKFCFRADRVRALKRELSIFQVLRDNVGQHPNIVGVRDVHLEEPPYYLIMDYAGGPDLQSWCHAKGGPQALPMTEKLEIVAQVADALEVAHSSHVIHRDVKPSNILINDSAAAPLNTVRRIQAKLSDFGIGQILSKEILARMTQGGFTMTMDRKDSPTGTHLYLAPELLSGKPASPQSDIYSLGVVLYQLLCNDFSRAVTVEWQERISGDGERALLAKCFAGDPERRWNRAADVALAIRELPAAIVDVQPEDDRSLPPLEKVCWYDLCSAYRWFWTLHRDPQIASTPVQNPGGENSLLNLKAALRLSLALLPLFAILVIALRWLLFTKLSLPPTSTYDASLIWHFKKLLVGCVAGLSFLSLAAWLHGIRAGLAYGFGCGLAAAAAHGLNDGWQCALVIGLITGGGSALLGAQAYPRVSLAAAVFFGVGYSFTVHAPEKLECFLAGAGACLGSFFFVYWRIYHVPLHGFLYFTHWIRPFFSRVWWLHPTFWDGSHRLAFPGLASILSSVSRLNTPEAIVAIARLARTESINHAGAKIARQLITQGRLQPLSSRRLT